MTTLGLVFSAAYIVSIFWGRRGVLFVASASIAFNDSAAVVVGQATISPFYLGILIYLTVSIFSPSWAAVEKPRSGRGIPLALLIYGILNAIVAPIMFEGVGVVAPGIGLDEQVGFLTPLSFTLSSVAQIIYLALNVGLIVFNDRDLVLRQSFLAWGLGVGVLVGMWAFSSWRFGFGFPQELFDNNPRGQYIINPKRLRAQFSEASHLGGFSVAALGFYLARCFQSSGPREVLMWLTFSAASGVLLVSTVSGTATLGAIVAVAALVGIALIAMIRRGPTSLRLSPSVLFGTMLVLVTVAFTAGPISEAASDVIDGKQGGTSIETRSYVDSNALLLSMQTGGVGVGLGNNRSSSMVFMLLSTIGIAGTILFAIIVFRAVSRGLSDPARRASAVTLVAFAAAAAVSLADFVSPVMWLCIALCYPRRTATPPQRAVAIPRAKYLVPRLRDRVIGSRFDSV